MGELAIWLLPAAVAIAALREPRWGFVVFAAGLPFCGAPPGGPYLAALDVAAIVLVLAALRLPRPPAGRLTPWLAAYAAAGLVSLLPAAYTPPSWHPRVLFGLLLALPGAETWTALHTWRAAANLILGLALIHALRRAFAGRSLVPLGIGLACGLAPVLLLGLAEHLGLVDLGGYRAIAENLRGAPRLHSLFFNSGWLAEFLVLTAPLAALALVALRRIALAVGLAALGTTTVVLCLSRGGWLALAVELVFLGALLLPRLSRGPHGRRRAGLVVVAVLAGAGLTLLALPAQHRQALGERIASPLRDTAGRGHLAGAALELTRQRPGFGSGLGSFAAAYDELHPPGSPGARRPRETAHNWALHVLAEGGVVGLLALLALAVATAAALGARLRRPAAAGPAADEGQPDPSEGGEETRLLAMGAAAGLLGAAVYGLVQYVPYLKAESWAIALLVGAAAVLDPRPPPRRGQWAAALGLTLVAALAVPVRLADPPPRWRNDRAFGLHETEWSGDRSFRWIEPRAALRVPWTASCLHLEFVDGHPAAGPRGAWVRVRAGGQQGELQLGGDWKELLLDLGPPQAPDVLVEIEAGPAFRPFSDFRRHGLGESRDIRKLAVALAPLTWSDCEVAAPASRPPAAGS